MNKGVKMDEIPRGPSRTSAWVRDSDLLISTAYRSFWNVLDLVSLNLMIVIVVLHTTRTSALAGQALSPLIAFEVSVNWVWTVCVYVALTPTPPPFQLIMVYFKLFFYAMGFESTGHLVQVWHLCGTCVDK